MPRAPSNTKPDTAISTEAIDRYTECSYSQALWVTTRYSQQVLPKAVTAVLVFLINRTLRYKKATDHIALSQFVDGVKTGEMLQTASCGYSKDTVTKALTLLTELGLVKREQVSSAKKGNTPTRYTILIKPMFLLARNVVPMTDKERNMARMNLSKRLKEINRLEGTPCPLSGHPLSVNRTPLVRPADTHIKVLHIKKNLKPTATSGRRTAEGDLQSISKTQPTALDAIKGIVTTLEGKSQESRAVRVASAKESTKLTMSGVNVLWQQSMKEHHPGVPFASLTTKTFAILKKAATTHTANRFSDFVDWAVENWEHTRTYSLQWYKQGGARLSFTPDVDQFARLYKHFIKAYAESHLGISHKVDEMAALRNRAEIAEGKVAQNAAALAASRQATEAALGQVAVAKRDAAQAIRVAGSKAGGTVRHTDQSMEEMRDEVCASESFSDSLPEWKDG